MIKDMAFGAVVLAQAIAMPYDGTWQLGEVCDPTDYDAHLTIQNGVTYSDSGSCFYEHVAKDNNNGYRITARCNFQDEPKDTVVRFIMKVERNNLWIYNGENGVLRGKLTRCR